MFLGDFFHKIIGQEFADLNCYDFLHLYKSLASRAGALALTVIAGHSLFISLVI